MREVTAVISIITISLLPLGILLKWILTYLKWKERTTLLILILIGGLFILGIGFLWITRSYFRPMIVTQKDIYGTYVIDRDKFPGKQADWQYEHFRFTITPNDELIFESLIYDNKWKSDTVKVSYSSGYYDLDRKEYCNRKIRIHSDTTSHHIIRNNPTLYRPCYNSFYYVFDSKKFGNVFFKKGEWKD